MKISRGEIVSTLIVAASYVVAILIYPYLPDLSATHWNARGDVNGYMPKFWAAFILPMICTVILALLLIFPRIDPKKENIEKFRKYFDFFIVVIFLFFLYTQALMLWANLGGNFDMSRAIIPALAVIFYAVGVLIGKAKMNYSIGIRTPWTLSNEVVWSKTHRLGSAFFKAAGILCLLGIFLSNLAFYIIIGCVILSVLVLFVYSYIEYRKQINKAP